MNWIELKTLFIEGDPISINTNLPWGPQNITSYIQSIRTNNRTKLLKYVAKNTKLYSFFFIPYESVFYSLYLLNADKTKCFTSTGKFMKYNCIFLAKQDI